jgi:hypothetical protein
MSLKRGRAKVPGRDQLGTRFYHQSTKNWKRRPDLEFKEYDLKHSSEVNRVGKNVHYQTDLIPTKQQSSWLDQRYRQTLPAGEVRKWKQSGSSIDVSHTGRVTEFPKVGRCLLNSSPIKSGGHIDPERIAAGRKRKSTR